MGAENPRTVQDDDDNDKARRRSEPAGRSDERMRQPAAQSPIYDLRPTLPHPGDCRDISQTLGARANRSNLPIGDPLQFARQAPAHSPIESLVTEGYIIRTRQRVRAWLIYRL